MPTDDDSSGPSLHGPAHFATTQWSLVLQAGPRSRPDADRALALLCQRYWYPLYAYVRRRGHAAADAQDLTQAFFVHLVEKQTLRVADPQRGKFRSFLLASLDHFLANHWRRENAARRGGGNTPLSLDLDSAESRYVLEPADPMTPEKIYERRWALTLLEQALERLRQEYEQDRRAEVFDRLKPSLTGEGAQSYAAVSGQLSMTAGAVKVAAHRLRKRYRELLREEIAQTLDAGQDVEDELRHLRDVLSG